MAGILHAHSGRPIGDMRFHVVGLGPIGALFAHNLRRSLPPQHDIHLMFRSSKQARLAKDQPILIERDGVVSKSTGYKTESTDDFQQQLHNLVFNKSGKIILPSRAARLSTDVTRVSPSEQAQKEKDISHIDSLFVTCKAYSTISVLEKIRQRLTSQSTIVLLQNGNLSVCEQLLNRVYKSTEERPHIILASINHGAWIKAPLHVVHAGLGTLRFAILPDGRRDCEKSRWEGTAGVDTPALSLDDIQSPEGDADGGLYWSLRNTVAALQRLSDLQPTWEPMSTLQVHLRQKLVANCVINPLTALMGCNNGELYGNPAAERLSRRLCMEAENVFRAEARANKEDDQTITDGTVDPHLLMHALHEECQRVAFATAGNISSMLAEVRRGSKVTEVDYLNGYLMQLGGRYRVPVATHATILDLIKLRTSIPLDTLL